MVLGSISVAQETDFIFQQPSDAGQGGAMPTNGNILFYLDGSASMRGSYKGWVEKDPATNHPDVLDYKRKIQEFESSLMHRDIIPSSLYYETNWIRCAEGYGFTKYGEGNRGGNCSKRKQSWSVTRDIIAREALRDILPDLKGMNVAIMRSALNNSGFGDNTQNIRNNSTADINAQDHGALVTSHFRPLLTTTDMRQMADEITQTYRPEGKDYIRGRPPFKTPLAESLLEIYYYLAGKNSIWTKSKATEWKDQFLDFIDPDAYVGPITGAYKAPNLNGDAACSPNHIVMLTDGEPTYDWSANDAIQALTGAAAPQYATPFAESDATPAQTLLDEMAGFLANTDLNPLIPGKQTAITHFVSTWGNEEQGKILDQAVQKSGGVHIKIEDINELRDALVEVTQNLNGTPQEYFVYQAEMVQSSNQLLATDDIAFVIQSRFSNGNWSSTLKRFAVGGMGELQGNNNADLIENNQQVNFEAVDEWSRDADSIGGAAENIAPIGTKRFTLAPNTNSNRIIRAENAFSMANAPQLGPLLAVTKAAQEPLYNWLQGMDIYDIDEDGDYTDVRTAFGDQINHPPQTLIGNDQRMTVYFGDNAGFLNAVDGQTGEHLYSFMPPELLPKAQLLAAPGDSTNKSYGIDSRVRTYELKGQRGQTRQYITFSLGKGGRSHYVLDVTDRNNPLLALRVNDQNPQFSGLADSWSAPVLTQIKTGDTFRDLAIISGGYDANMTQGNSVYLADIATGELLWSIGGQGATVQLPEQKFPIANRVLPFDLNEDGYADVIAYNDIRGNIFRCDFDSTIAKANIPADGINCRQLASAQNAADNLVFTAPLDVSLTQGVGGLPQIVYSQASGNRLNPNQTASNDRLMVVFDDAKVSRAQLKSENQPIIKGQNLPRATTTNAVDIAAVGWNFYFPNNGEKSFGQSLVFNNTIFQTSYQAGGYSNSTDQACGATVNQGTARIYAFNLANGGRATIVDKPTADIWQGPSRSLPSSPDVVKKMNGKTPSIFLNLGVDNTDIQLKFNPVKRQYWYSQDRNEAEAARE